MSAYTYPAIVPPGQSPPFAVVTSTDHRAWIFITAALGLSMTVLSSAIRIFIRYGTSSTWGLDDASLGLSTVLAFVQTALILTAGSHGLGSSKSVASHGSLVEAQKLYYASNLLYILSLGASRLSIVFFLRRLTPVRRHIQALNYLLCGEAVWTVAIFLAVALQCNLELPWILGPTCATGWFVRWEVAEITAALFEIAIFAVAVWALVWKLHTKLGKKLVIVTVFGARLPLLVTILALRLASFNKAGFRSDPTLHEASFICWTQAEMNLSIIAATIPMAHKLLSNLVTYYGGPAGRTASESIHRPSQEHKADATQLRQLSEHSGSSKSTKPDSQREKAFGSVAESSMYSYGIETRQFEGSSLEDEITCIPDAERSESFASRKMMIRKDVSYQVEFDK